MRILFCWELGDNYGHVLRQLPIVRRLQARGHHVLCAVKDVTIAEQVFTPLDIPFVQAPVQKRRQSTQREIASFADLLVQHGFSEPTALDALIHAWHHLFQLCLPKVVVVDHAPAAAFAARLLGIPVAAIGTGFELPPPVSPFPCFRSWLAMSPNLLQQTEARILANLNRMCSTLRRPLLTQLSELVQADANMLLSFEELDHYPERKSASYLGGLPMLDDGLREEWPSRHDVNVFAYVRPCVVLPAMLNGLRETAANVICVVPGIDPVLKARYETPALRIFDTYVQLAPLLRDCDLVISHAGHGVASACVLAGISMLAIPTQIEQMMLCDRIVELGVGLSLPLSGVVGGFSSALTTLLVERRFAENVQTVADRYKDHDPVRLVEHIVQVIEQLT